MRNIQSSNKISKHQESLMVVLAMIALLLPLASIGETLHGESYMVASRSDLASEAGQRILREGGNAIDAAVATGFALAVTYPSAGNIGGGGFMVISLPNGSVNTLDYRETAPILATRDMFLDASGNVDRKLALSSMKSSGVPGSVAGMLEALERYGSLPRQQVLAPAIELAENGFILNEDIAGQFQDNLSAFRENEAAIAIFTHDNVAYRAGELWTQPDLADTLKRIAKAGRDGFYRGKTADLIVNEMQRANGLISYADLEGYKPIWREPVRGEYHGFEIWSMPPPSSGGILLIQMLNMLEPYNLGKLGWGNIKTLQLMIEAQRRAYADRAEYLGDPDFYEVPMAKLMDKGYARERFSDVEPSHATLSTQIKAGAWPKESMQTTHYSVVDSQGMAVSVTTTLNRSYGNRKVVTGAGFLLNNEMDDFSSKPYTPNSFGLLGGDANAIAPGKRMLSSMTPTIIKKNGQVTLITGSPGGSTIINTVLQVILNVLDHGMSVEDAVAAPRIHHQWMPDMVRYEPGAIPPAALKELKNMDYKGLTEGAYGIGDANTIEITDSEVIGVSDPRNVGGVAGD
jgi:gamma-glutamyltranspeptidase/glutathione hydrolase